MRKSVLASVVFATAHVLLSGPAFALAVGQTDTFEGQSLDGWFAGGLGFGAVPPVPPQVVSGGGPAGAADDYLQITASGGGGPGSRLVAMNAAQWGGNFLAAGISGIAMDLRNFGSTELTVRLLFEDPMGGPPLNEAVTTFGATLPAGGDWTHIVFPIGASALTALEGSAAAALGNTTLLRIIHAPTAGDAVAVNGVLGVDNIQAVPEPRSLALTSLALVVLAFVHRCRRRMSTALPA